ncbi:MAG: hypothetical protein GY805_29745, partial [Chloroflexi bacterium]|nr:hypothetical protein [Chloroflexota bacterium]
MLQLKFALKKMDQQIAISNPSRRHIRLFIILFAFSLIILLPSLIYAASRTKTNATDGAADGGEITRIVEFTTADFSAGASISSVTATLQFAKIDAVDAGSCFTTGHQNGDPVNREIYMYLTSPNSTRVDLIYNAPNFTYSSNAAYGGTVTIIFDDNAAAQVGGLAPTSGTFRPEEPLGAFWGEEPLGTWTLTIGDSLGGAPLCFYDFSLTVNAEQAPVVDDQTFTVAEDSLNSTFVDTIVATDADPDDKLSYNVTGGTGAAVFDVGILSGDITVADENQLTTPGSFVLDVEVVDSAALSDTATITITVTAVNDAPIITEGITETVTMDEDGNPTPFSLTLNATDEE